MVRSEFIGVRLKSNEAKIIAERAKEQYIDKSTALRQLLWLGIKQFRLEKSISLYKEGKISIGRASEIASISIWEMMDILIERNIASNLTKEDFDEGMKNIKKVFKF